MTRAGRRRLLTAAAVAGGVALLVLGRPGPAEPEREPHSHPPDPAAAAAPGNGPTDPAAAGPAAPGPAAGDPSAGGTTGPPPPPVIRDGGVAGGEALDPAELPAAVAAAERFAAAWADPAPDWHARLAGLATPELAAALAAADPPQPAPQLTGTGQVYYDAPEWARVAVPAVRGTVVLDVVAAGDGWLVSAVDWWPG